MINHIQSELVASILYRDLLEEFEGRQRRGVLGLREDVVYFWRMTTAERPGLQGRVLLSIGDFLISFGRWLKGRGETASPLAVL